MTAVAKTLLITGVSTGLGRAFATDALDAGHTVVGTVRDPDQIDGFERLAQGRAYGRCRLEVYRTNPAEEPEPDKWKTDLVFRLAQWLELMLLPETARLWRRAND